LTSLTQFETTASGCHPPDFSLLKWEKQKIIWYNGNPRCVGSSIFMLFKLWLDGNTQAQNKTIFQSTSDNHVPCIALSPFGVTVLSLMIELLLIKTDLGVSV
jgi:hypothetical protein